MNALKSQSDSSLQRPARPHRVRPQQVQPQATGRRSRIQHRRQSPHQAAILEVSLKLTVNLILIATGLSTLAHLIPHNMSQQSDLERLRGEVKEASAKVGGLQEEFDRQFDPQQALNVMQEQNIRFNPRQKQVVWLKPDASEPAEKTAERTAEARTSSD